MKPLVLIIGSKGMLGQSLVSLFSQDAQYQVIGWDREDIDISDKEHLQKKIPSLSPKIIINATGYNAVDRVEEDQSSFVLAQMVNGYAPGELARLASELDAIFVHFSSDYVFDGEKGRYVETDTPCPVSRYGQTKLLGEQTVQQLGNKYYIIRTSKLFGEPAIAPGAKKSFFEVMIEQSKQHDTLNVVDGERSCFTYVPDLAQTTKMIVEEHVPYGIYHIVNEGGVTWYEGAVRMFALLEKKIIIQPVSATAYSRPAKRPTSSVLINTKLPKLRSYDAALQEWLQQLQLF